MSFQNKIVIVFGGTSGIGLEVYRLLIEDGAKVYMSARSEPQDLENYNFKVCDVTDLSSCKKVVEDVLSIHGSIDIVINSFGCPGLEKIEDISEESWDRVLDTNLKGVFNVCKSVLPIMKKNRYGKIVNISSVAGHFRSLSAGAHYSASKAGVIGFTRQLSLELIDYNININVVCPSQTLTPMLENNLSSDQIKDIEQIIPRKRLASVTEQANPILFLCSDAASYMNGAVVDVNGGQF
jgi:3-oxoacyl-[acyl-carrier protein] reductase